MSSEQAKTSQARRERADAGLVGRDDRRAFEDWITSPPFERDVRRRGRASAWPGQYVEYEVQLAWEAWREARSA